MTRQYLLAIDQGTTGTKVVLLDVTKAENPVRVARSIVDFPQHYPKPGWVEHDLGEIWQSAVRAVEQALAEAGAKMPDFNVHQIAAIGITNQRETLCVFDRKTGEPLRRAIVWQDKRSSAICERMRADGREEDFRSRTGLVLDPYFSGTKMTWLMENEPAVAARLRDGTAVWGTIDTFLLHRLTGAAVFATEASNASRTLVYDIGAGRFDTDLAKLLGVPSLSSLAEVKDSAGSFGKTKGLSFLPDGIPISGVLGDQQAALAGQACFDVGEAKCTYGTGAFLVFNTGNQRLRSSAGMLTTVAWSLGGKLTYAFEGAAFIAGASIQFLRDQLGILESASEAEAMAATCVGAPEVYFVPSLSGLGAPYWNPAARGAFFGLTRGTSKGQMVRAALEGIAFQVNDLIEAMHRDAVATIRTLRVDGGAAENNLLLEIQANLSGIAVDRPQNLDTTAVGAALFAGMGVGIYRDLDQMKAARQRDRLFEVDRSEAAGARREHQLAGWRRAVQAVELFAAR